MTSDSAILLTERLQCRGIQKSCKDLATRKNENGSLMGQHWKIGLTTAVNRIIYTCLELSSTVNNWRYKSRKSINMIRSYNPGKTGAKLMINDCLCMGSMKR